MQRVIAFNKKFKILKNFKNYFQIVNMRLNNIRFKIFFKTNSKSQYIIKRITIIVIDTTLFNYFVISKNIQVIFDIKRKILQNICI